MIELYGAEYSFSRAVFIPKLFIINQPGTSLEYLSIKPCLPMIVYPPLLTYC